MDNLEGKTRHLKFENRPETHLRTRFAFPGAFCSDPWICASAAWASTIPPTWWDKHRWWGLLHSSVAIHNKEYTRPPLTRWAMSTAAAWQQTIWSVPVWPREKATLTHQSQQWHGRLPFAKESGEAMTPVWDQCTLSMIIHRLYELVPTQFCDVKCNKQAWTVRCRYYSVAVKLADIQLMPLTHDLKFLLAFSQFEQSWNIFRFLKKKNFDTCHSGKK